MMKKCEREIRRKFDEACERQGIPKSEATDLTVDLDSLCIERRGKIVARIDVILIEKSVKDEDQK